MERFKWWSAGLLLAAGLSFSVNVHAQDADAEETALQKEETTINETMGDAGADRKNALAEQFRATPEQVDALRAKTGWGGATIQLAMAQNLMKTDPAAYPTMTEALAKVDSLRAEGKGYGAMAKELGFKLGPVVSAAQHARHEARRSRMSAERPGKPEKASRDRPPKAERPSKPGRPAKAARPDKPPRP